MNQAEKEKINAILAEFMGWHLKYFDNDEPHWEDGHGTIMYSISGWKPTDVWLHAMLLRDKACKEISSGKLAKLIIKICYENYRNEVGVWDPYFAVLLMQPSDIALAVAEAGKER